MTDIQILDKVIPQGYANQIEADVLRTGFPWYFIDDVTNPNYGSNSGLVHPAFDFGQQPSEWYAFIKPLVYAIEEATGNPMSELLRIRVGCLTPTNEVGYDFNTPHVDFTMNHWTACYYVNDSDGDTVLFDQTLDQVGTGNIDEQRLIDFVKQSEFTVAQRCSPQKGRLCIFNGKRFHSSTKPTAGKRVVITVNYI
jgi:hypothetical protein